MTPLFTLRATILIDKNFSSIPRMKPDVENVPLLVDFVQAHPANNLNGNKDEILL